MYQFSFLFNLLLIFIASYFLTGCYRGDIVPIDGELRITVNRNENFCFTPIFKTLENIDGNIPNTIFLNKIVVRDLNLKTKYSYMVVITPTDGNYSFRINDTQKVCLNEKNKKLKQALFSPIQGDSIHALLQGKSEDGKTIYNFTKIFSY